MSHLLRDTICNFTFLFLTTKLVDLKSRPIVHNFLGRNYQSFGKQAGFANRRVTDNDDFEYYFAS